MSENLRCDAVLRELAAPSADRDHAALADHLAACHSCAWASQLETLKRHWADTRPDEPTAFAWDGVWNRLSDQLDQLELEPAAATTIPIARATPSGGWRSRGMVLFSLAQAAAIFLAFGLLFLQQPHEVAASTTPVDIETGQVVVIRDDGAVIRTAAVSDPGALDDSFAMLNALESMAE